MSRDKLAIAERTGLIMIFVGTTQAVIPFPVNEVNSHDGLLAVANLVREQRAVAFKVTEQSWAQTLKELARVLSLTMVVPSDVQYLDSDEMSSMAVAHLDVMTIDDFEKIRKYAGTNTAPVYGDEIDNSTELDDGFDDAMEDMTSE